MKNDHIFHAMLTISVAFLILVILAFFAVNSENNKNNREILKKIDAEIDLAISQHEFDCLQNSNAKIKHFRQNHPICFYENGEYKSFIQSVRNNAKK